VTTDFVADALGHTKDSLWSLDLFRTESILLRSHWVLVVLISLLAGSSVWVQAVAVDGSALCRMFNQAIAGQGPPTRLSTDHDPLFRFGRWQANLRILDVERCKRCLRSLVTSVHRTAHRDPAPGVFGSPVLLTADDLVRKLELFKKFYNAARVHQGLSGDTPRRKRATQPSTASLENYRWQSHCYGLFELPIAAEW